MLNLLDTLTKASTDFNTTNRMFAKFTDEEISQATHMKVFGTSINHPGDDYCVFKLMNEKDEVISVKQVDGY